MPEGRTLSEPEFNSIKDSLLKAAPEGMGEAEFQRWIGPRLSAAVATAEHLPPAAEGSAFGRFVSNLGAMINPVSMAEGMWQAGRHPIDTASNIIGAQVDQGKQAIDLAKQGRYSEAVGHGAAAVVPVIGPAAAKAGEQIASGDVAGGLGAGTGLLAPVLAPAGIRMAKRAAGVLPESAAEAAEGAAARRVTDVMAPKVGPNKVRFGNMAEDVAPKIAEDLATEGAPWTRGGLQSRISARLEEATQALDSAADARLNARTFETKPIIDALLEKRRALTAETVDATKPARAVTERASAIVDAQGKPLTVAESKAIPLGRDVVPGPNAARVAEIDRAISEVQDLGPVARYEAIRRIRQAYDGPAKAVYSPSMTADYLKSQGGKLGAADVTGVLRNELAQWDPATAQANARYSLYRTANDVLEATEEVERTRPRVGRVIAARVLSTVLGEKAAGVPGAVAGYGLAPAFDAVASAGGTVQLKTASLLGQLAKAIRTGDPGMVSSLTTQLRRVAQTSAAVVGNATNPNALQAAPAGARP